MSVKVRRPPTALRSFTLVAFAALSLFAVLLSLLLISDGDALSRDAGLLDRARLGSWRSTAEANPPTGFRGFQESDFIFANGKYYLFSTGSQDPAWVDVYVSDTPEGLAHK